MSVGLVLAMLAVQAPAADVVVTGQRLVAIQAACARGGCTVLRDAQASIALAEQQFRQGRYLDARGVLAAAVSRNRTRAATDPKPVAALYEAYATILLHEGDLDRYQRAVAGQVRTLREHLPPGDPARESAVSALGEMWIKRGRLRTAEQVFMAGERQATAAGQPGVAVRMAIRRVSVLARLGDAGAARRLLAEIEARPAAGEAQVRPALRVLAMRLAVDDADPAAVDRLVAEIGRDTVTRPTLIWAPPYEPTASAASESHGVRYGLISPVAARSSEVGGIAWADIGFWIRPDGQTAEAEVLRGSRGTGWTAPLLQQIGQRRYTMTAGGDGPGVYRLERFTLRGTYSTPIDSLIPRRGGATYLETLDLTDPSARVTATR